MKKILLILVFLTVVFLKNTSAQAPVTDTSAYLQNIVSNKANYIGLPFSTLLDTLQIQIKYFHPRRGIVHDKSKETYTRFGFYFPQSADELYLTYPSIEIFWQHNLNANQSNTLWENNNGGGWAPTVASFYSTGIVADIRIRE